MWVHRSAIKPVPRYARIDEATIEQVLDGFAREADESHDDFDAAFAEFEEAQPVLAHYVSGELARNLSEPAMALGYFLALCIWLSFERAQGRNLNQISKEALDETCQLLELDQEMRKADANEPLDTDDIVRMEQPRLVSFIHEHIENALDLESTELEMNELQVVYRMVLIMTLSFSYAVRAPAGYPAHRTGMLA